MSSQYTLMSTGLGILPWPFLGLGSTMDPQAYNSPTYTHVNNNTYTYTNSTLISTYTYINNTPYSATPHNNHLPFTFYLFTCQHKQYKQYGQTHQRYFSNTAVVFHIIHYQVLRHQDCIHSLECNQYWKSFHDSTSEKCAPLSRCVPCRPYSYPSDRS